MVSSGIRMAATVRVAHAVGRNDHPGIMQSGLVAIMLRMVLATLVVTVIALRLEFAKFFLGRIVRQYRRDDQTRCIPADQLSDQLCARFQD